MKHTFILTLALLLLTSATYAEIRGVPPDKQLKYPQYSPKPGDLAISRSQYAQRLHGFWLGECIANWTGLRTEFNRKEAPFYTDKDWGHKNRVFVLVDEGDAWGADDDTDIEYIYQHALDSTDKCILAPEDIRDAWLKHILPKPKDPRLPANLWVSNAGAWMKMREGILPPQTSLPMKNPHFDQIDAQLTTEIFGLFAPARPDIALKMAHLPIRTSAYRDAEWISEFYVIMHSLASYVDPEMNMQDRVFWLAEQARKRIPEQSYAASMYDFVKDDYRKNPDKEDWERTRDALYEKYQLNGEGGYMYKSATDAGINYGASIVSLFYGRGDYKRTIRIGALCGWDSDNPTSTWGGLLGFMLARESLEKAFPDNKLSNCYKISRTRSNFPDRTPDQIGEDTFQLMAQRAVHIIDRVVIEQIGGGVDLQEDLWYIPNPGAKFETADFAIDENAFVRNASPLENIQAELNKFAPGWTIETCGRQENPGLRDEWQQRKNVFVTHPLHQSVPCILTRNVNVPKGKKTSLILGVGHDPRGDWTLIVSAGDKKLLQRNIDSKTCKDGWTEVSVDLSDFAGEPVTLKLENRVLAKMSFETGFWSKIEIRSL
ncbi:MAG: ADP-ribosylglycohydrolase family protein [Phycisphaerae bacterium]|nr:ADP-ribosylglycohydrolase family protein [Phycisphaerae bacterium]